MRIAWGPAFITPLMSTFFLQSLARAAGRNAIGVVLSGPVNHGTVGLRVITEAGGRAFVQSPAQATFPDMPTNAIDADGPIDLIRHYP